MNKKLAAAAVAVVVIGGGVAASLTVAGAQTGTTTPSTVTQPPNRPDRGAAEKSTLDPLVTDGTLTQDQEDKVIAALKTAGPEGGGMGEMGGRFGMGDRGGFGAASDAVAQALGITTDQLKTDLEAGRSIADIAAAQHVDVATVIQVITDQANTKIDAAVQAGKMTQAEADKIKAGETQMITDLVNGKMPFGGHGGPGHGHGLDGPPPAADSTTTTPSLPSS